MRELHALRKKLVHIWSDQIPCATGTDIKISLVVSQYQEDVRLLGWSLGKTLNALIENAEVKTFQRDEPTTEIVIGQGATASLQSTPADGTVINRE